MNSENNFKKIYLLIFVFVMMVANVGAEPTAYAEYQDGVLVFKYGEKPNKSNVYDASDTGSYPGWYDIRNSISTVMFESSFITARPKSCNSWFRGMVNLTTMSGLYNLNTSNVTDMSYMFSGCASVNALNVYNFNTSNVTDMSHMFSGCASINALNLNNFNTSNVTDMSDMFSGCTSLNTLNVNNFNTSNVTDMSYMFDNCISMSKLDLLNFNTVYVTNMECMFSRCKSISAIDLSSFNTSNVTNMMGMFYNFAWLGGLKCLDVSGFDVSKVTDMSYMFYNCDGLTTIYCDDSWNCEKSNAMFESCTKLRGAIPYDASKTDCTYANTVTGYFTNTIIPDTFDIKLSDYPITSVNCNDLTAIPGVTGTASYDNETKTLNLEDASIIERTLAGGYAIKTTLDTLHVNVEGECNISSSKGVGLHSNSRNVVIGGTGTLNINASTAGIVMNSTAANSLDIDDEVTVNVEADTYGMVGREVVQRRFMSLESDTTYTTTLKVGGENSKLSVKGTEQSFLTLKAFEPADGYKVTSPSRTAFDPASNTFCRVTATSSGSGKIGTGLVLTLVPVAGTAVVIEKPYILGDVNGDGSITMADANMVVNYFLATDPSTIANFNVAAADVNGDGSITMADANQIVNIFLGQ
ncbi:MAG: BspA family leucine-rich repeat surface protein [Prevotella sp.]|nr:BspA family leucine-rich repeat surface protein [Prevotella sp.]